MIIVMYRWNIPVDKDDEFEYDWKNVFPRAARLSGLRSAKLYNDVNNYLVVTEWQDLLQHSKARTSFENSEFFRTWRAHESGSREVMKLLVSDNF